MRHNLASPAANSRPVATVDYVGALGVFHVLTNRNQVAFNLPQAVGMAERDGYRVRLSPAALATTGVR